MVKKRFANLILPILLSLFSIAVGCASFIITIYDTNGVPNENAIPTVDKISQAEAYIDETGQYYASVEYALAAANLRNGKSTVYVIPGTNPVIDTPCIVGENVTLNFPYDGKTLTNEADRGMSITGHDSASSGFGSEKKDNIKNNVTISPINGLATITIKDGGAMYIGGSRRSGSPQSATADSCVVLTMGENAIIDCHGKIYNYGFIKETTDNNGSKINVFSSGGLWQQLVVYDWSSASSNGNLIYPDPIVFPFNYFDSCQIAPVINFFAGSLFKGMVWLYGNRAGDMYEEGTIISSQNKETGLIMAQNNSSSEEYVSWKNTDVTSNENNLTTNKNKHIIDININGDYNFESFLIDLEYAGRSVTIDSSDYFIPFSNFFHLNINSGNININEKVQLLPGSSVVVGKDATVNFNNEFIVLESAINPNNSSQSIVAYDSNNKNVAAKFINNGTVIINSAFGGKIEASSDGNAGSKIIVNNDSAVTVKEVVSYGDWGPLVPGIGATEPTLFSVTESANADVINDSNDISNTNLAINSTYQWINYNGSYCWEKIEPKYVNISIDNESQSGEQPMDVHYVLNVDSGGRITQYDETVSSIAVYPGEIVYFESINNYSSVSINGVAYQNILNERFVVSDSDINIEITPLFRASQLVKFTTENIAQDGYYIYEPSYQVKVITAEGYEQIYDKPSEITVFEGDTISFASIVNIDSITVSNTTVSNIVIDDILNYSHLFNSTNEELEFVITPSKKQHYDLSHTKLLYQVDKGRWQDAENNGNVEFEQGTYSINFQIKIYNTKGEDVTANQSDYTIEWTPTSITPDDSDSTKASGSFSSGANKTISVTVTDDLTKTFRTFTLTIIVKNQPCFESGTIINTNHGPKAVENLTKEDLILTFNHFTGEYEYKPIALLVDHGKGTYKVMELYFDDGSYIGFIENHGLFDATLNRYVDFTYDNYKSYIGDEFIKYDNGQNKYVTLIDAKLVNKETNSYTVISSENQNSVANGLLNITTVLYGIYNIFEYDENHVYDLDSMNANIALYGTYSYEDFAHLITEKVFNDFGFKYFKVAIGKGLMTYDQLIGYIYWFYDLIESGEAVIY